MGRFQVRLAAGLLGAVALFALPTGAQAQGYGLYEHNACAMARAGTGVASPCGDGSAMFFNPAGLTDISGKVGSLGGVLINTSGSFTADQNGAVTNLKDGHYPAPNAYLAANVGDGYAIGLGLFAPYGLTTEWPTNGAGRFLGYRSKIQAIYLQPTIALKITDNLSIGGGPDINFLSLQLYQHLDLAAQTVPGQAFTFASLGIPQGTDFADAKLSGSGTGFGYHFGVQWKVTDKISLGARYLGRQRVWINSATAAISQLPTGIILAAGNPFGVPAGTPLDSVVAPSFRGSGPLQNQGGKTMLRMPDQLVVGTAVKVTPKLTGLFDVQWTNWTVFDSIPLSFDRLPGKALTKRSLTSASAPSMP